MNSGYRAALRAKQFALCSPIEGQASVVHQPVRGELWRMPFKIAVTMSGARKASLTRRERYDPTTPSSTAISLKVRLL
jgi:hypothetical protein